MRALSPMQGSLFMDLPEASIGQAQHSEFDHKEFLRRMTVVAKEQTKTNKNNGLSMLHAAISDMQQLSLIGLPEDEMLNWTESDIYAIHEYMLISSLESFNDSRLSEKRIRQIVSWIAEPLFRAADPEPFSFAACCLCTGVDPEKMQDTLLTTIVPSLFK